jgi:hypothetical protein
MLTVCHQDANHQVQENRQNDKWVFVVSASIEIDVVSKTFREGA